jgi:DNA-binding NtrC family response regulator
MRENPAFTVDHGLTGNSPRIAEVRRLIDKSARNRLPVLLLGESGTGKEVVARAIHQVNSPGNLVPIDCGSVVGALMESELFGHVKGAFTGATESKKGLIEVADGGTAFFDEIGDLALELQVKLLRLLQEHEYRPVGAVQSRKVDLRVIAATHRDLKAEVAAGRFRLDLYYRLNVFPIRIPPLRERKEDIPLLIESFAGGESDLPTPELLRVFEAYDWPGNVRELKHCVERIIALRSDSALRLADMPSPLQNYARSSEVHTLARAVERLGDTGRSTTAPLPIVSIADAERRLIFAALAATNGDRHAAAKSLGISRTTLYRRMKQYKLEPQQRRWAGSGRHDGSQLRLEFL